MNEQYYIIRTNRAGVFFGKIKERAGQEVTMTAVRRLWHWNGATECIQLAAEGVKNPSKCKFTMTVPEVIALEAIEIIPCSAEAAESIKAVPEWKI